MSAADLLTSVGLRIRTLRKERGWSRRELGERAGLSERFLSQVEAGRGNPSVKSLAEIASALETSPAALLQPRTETVALLGLRGAGKSSVGRALADRLRRPFVELDARVEEAAGLSLAEIWELHGEATYRQLEREALTQVLETHPRSVIATGGGLVTEASTFDLLRQNAVTVWLRARPEVHWDRVLTQGDHRPMANDPLAMQRLRKLLEERDAVYRRAHHVVETSDLDVGTVALRIDELLRHPG
jgi:XRE family aerobic/anaerobic benzoate catabolism transcriptional regulator